MAASLNSRQMTQSENGFCQAGDTVSANQYSSFSITVLSNGRKVMRQRHSDEDGFIELIHVFAEPESY